MHHHARRQQPDVADPVGDEGPHRRLGRIRAILKESDQQRRGDAEEFPPGKQHVDAARQHHQIHAGAKQGQEQEEAGEAGLAMEILAGKGIDQGAEAGRKTDVGHRQTIGHQIDRGLVVAHGKPGSQMHRLRGKAPQRQHAQRGQPGQQTDRESRPDQPGRQPLRKVPPQQGRHPNGHQRCRRGSQLRDHQQRDRVVGGGERQSRLAKGCDIEQIHPDPPADFHPASTCAGGRLPRWPPYH